MFIICILIFRFIFAIKEIGTYCENVVGLIIILSAQLVPLLLTWSNILIKCLLWSNAHNKQERTKETANYRNLRAWVRLFRTVRASCRPRSYIIYINALNDKFNCLAGTRDGAWTSRPWVKLFYLLLTIQGSETILKYCCLEGYWYLCASGNKCKVYR